MTTIKKHFLFASICITTLTSPVYCFSATNFIPFEKVEITETNSISAEEALKILSESILLPEDMTSKSNQGTFTLLDSIDYTQLLSSKTGTEFMNKLYPSGVRLPTMLYDPTDAVRFTLDELPYEVGNGCKLLWLMCKNAGEERFNFTLAEQRAADKYYILMQLKSIALGLPIYSFTELDSNNSLYTKEHQEQAKVYVESFEKRFGTIYFIDTSILDYDWCEQLDIQVPITKDKVLPYPIPKGSKTIQLYQDYSNYFNALQSVGIGNSNEVSIEDFLTLDEIKANYNHFMNENGSYSFIDSILLTGLYYEQIPLDLYEILSVGGDNTVNEKEKPTVKEQQENANTENTKDDNNSSKEVNDPYFNALRNQSSNKFDIKSLENDSTDSKINYKVIYQNICLIVFSIGAIIAIIFYFLNKTQGR